MGVKHIYYKEVKILFFERGEGKTLVFLHGFLENHKIWEPYFEKFSKDHRVIAIDLLGHGQTASIDKAHTMEEMADVVFAVINELNIQNITIIGHSMGGYVALAFAELYPKNIRGIALIASTSLADSTKKKVDRERTVELIKKNSPLFINIATLNLFINESHLKFAKEIQKTKIDALNTPIEGMIAALEGMKIRKNRKNILRSATFPIILILGEHDPLLPYKKTAEQIKNTKIELIKLSGGHMLHIEAQKSLGYSLHNFIENNKL